MTKKQSFYFCVIHCLLLFLLLAWLLLNNSPVAMTHKPTANQQASDSAAIQCVSYAPYYGKGQSPLVKGMWIKPAQIDQDLAKLSQITNCVRTYSVGQGLDYVPEAAKKIGMQVYLGAWVGWTDADNIKEIRLAAEKASAYPDVVKALIVGNEVLLRQEQTPQSMQAYLAFAKTLTSVPITYADVWEFWLKNKTLENYVDFHTVHILPYWEDDPKPISEAVAHIDHVMTTMENTFKKPILIGETGWPSKGRQRYQSAPSLVNQARYIHGFVQKAAQRQWQYNIIEAIDQPWKRAQEGTVGGYWGLLNNDLSLKYSIGQAVAERQDGWPMVLSALLSAGLFLGIAVRLGATTLRVKMGLVAIGLMSGIFFVLQWQYVFAASTNIVEWFALGGIATFAALLSLLWPVHVFAPGQYAAKIHTMMKLLNLLFLYAALYTGYVIYMDGRYRNFPIMLFALPVSLLVINRLFAFRPIKARRAVHGIVAIGAVWLAFLCYSYEPNNNIAALWMLLCLGLAYASWPEKLASCVFKSRYFLKNNN